MKISKFFFALAMGGMMVACAPKAEEAATEGEGVAEAAEVAPKEKTAKDYVASKAQKDSVAYLIGINLGSFLKGYNFGNDLSFAQIEKGIKDFLKAEGDYRDPEFGKQFKVDPMLMNEVFNKYLENRYHHTALTNKEKGAKWLASNAKRQDVKTTASGLQYRIVAEGNPEVKAGPVDTVWVNYKGTLLDGKVFDQTPEGAEPVKMVLNQVIKGWTEGLQLVGEGGEIDLFIPSELAYGEGGNQGIEPNSTLIFNVKISKVGKFVAPDPADGK